MYLLTYVVKEVAAIVCGVYSTRTSAERAKHIMVFRPPDIRVGFYYYRVDARRLGIFCFECNMNNRLFNNAFGIMRVKTSTHVAQIMREFDAEGTTINRQLEIAKDLSRVPQGFLSLEQSEHIFTRTQPLFARFALSVEIVRDLFTCEIPVYAGVPTITNADITRLFRNIPAPKRPTVLRPSTPLLRAFIHVRNTRMFFYGLFRLSPQYVLDNDAMMHVNAILHDAEVQAAFNALEQFYFDIRLVKTVARADAMQRGVNYAAFGPCWQFSDYVLRRFLTFLMASNEPRDADGMFSDNLLHRILRRMYERYHMISLVPHSFTYVWI